MQVSFRVPRPEAFDLRRWFQGEVNALFARELEVSDDARTEIRQRLAIAIDILGGRYLKTPRHVVRALNSLRLHATPVRDKVDIPDMVWLQLVRIGNPALYDWVEEYLTEVAAVANGATITGNTAGSTGAKLKAMLIAEGLDIDRAWIDLGEILPGISGSPNQEAPTVFRNLGGAENNRFIVGRRLGSPHHYRYYFAFSEPSGAMRDERVAAFINTASSNPNDAIAMFALLAEETRPQGGTMAEVLVDRIVASAERIPEAAVPGILASFASKMDQIALATPAGDFGEHRVWILAARAAALLLHRTTGETRMRSLQALFTEGRSLGWLTKILRHEIFCAWIVWRQTRARKSTASDTGRIPRCAGGDAKTFSGNTP